MTKQYPIDRLPTHWPEIATELAQGNPVELLGTDNSIGILVSSETYQHLSAPQSAPSQPGSFWDGLLAFRAKADFTALDPNEDIFANLRDPSPGREVDL